MNTLKLHKVLYAAVIALFVATSAQAGAGLNYFEEYAYQDKLMRCVDLLRPKLQLQDTDKVSYEIEDINLRGPWYRFEIKTTIVDVDGEKVLDGYKIGCKANRWVDATELLARRNKPELPLQLDMLARNR